MLTPEIIELCKQASVEQDVDRLLYFVTEINRLIAIRNDEHRKQFALTSAGSNRPRLQAERQTANEI